MIAFTVEPTLDKTRIDHAVVALTPELSRSFVQSLCKQGKVFVNETPVKSGYKLVWGDRVRIDYDIGGIGSVSDIDLPVIYEDDTVLVVDKPSGVLSHALSRFHTEPSVASFLRQKLHTTAAQNGDMRYGIVHRLDRLTSGVMICAKNGEALTHLQKQFASRSVQKRYIALVAGTPAESKAVIDLPIERNPKKPATFRVGSRGKHAVTRYEVIKSSENRSLIRLTPETGRTHQLRVHLSYIGTPIVGDVLYGGSKADRLYLHAHELQVVLPGDSRAMSFVAQLPSSFRVDGQNGEVLP